MGEFVTLDKKEEYVYNYYAGRDQLTEIVTTDANGNRTVEYNLYNKLGTPYSYRGRFMNWEGNKLTSCGDKTYSYDASGRFANFKYEGDKLINDGRRYMYGVDGVLGFFIGGRKYYFYQKNLFGDVVGIKEYKHFINDFYKKDIFKYSDEFIGIMDDVYMHTDEVLKGTISGAIPGMMVSFIQSLYSSIV